MVEYTATWARVIRTREQMNFLKNCRKAHTMPKFITNATNHLMGRNEKHNQRISQLQDIMLGHSLSEHKRRIHADLTRTRAIYSKMREHFPFGDMQRALDILRDANRTARNLHESRLRAKWNHLIGKKQEKTTHMQEESTRALLAVDTDKIVANGRLNIPFSKNRVNVPEKNTMIHSKAVACSHAVNRILDRYNKGGDFTAIDPNLDFSITKAHLADNSTYCTASKADFMKLEEMINSTWTAIYKGAGGRINKNLYERLITRDCTPPCLYTLIKTHKLKSEDLLSTDPSIYKIRPIISSIEGPADRISWLLNAILSPLLDKVPSYLKNTAHFINKLGDLTSDSAIASFDVEALYTNIPNSDAIESTMEFLDEYRKDTNLFGLTLANIRALLNACLSCNIFTFKGHFYRQKRGLAMGNRIAPVLAILFMHHIESKALTIHPRVFARYIDDIFIATASEEELKFALNALNGQCASIRLTQERPNDEGWLAFLDTEVRVYPNIESRWYRKSANKNILLHAKSAHPACMKSNIVSNTLARANLSSSEAYINHSRTLAGKILEENGYQIPKAKKRLMTRRLTSLPKEREPNPILPIPFISEKFTREIRDCIKSFDLPINVNAETARLSILLKEKEMKEPELERPASMASINTTSTPVMTPLPTYSESVRISVDDISSNPSYAVSALHSELRNLMSTYEQTLARIRQLESEVGKTRDLEETVKEYEEQYKELSTNYENLLEAHGERLERLEELELDLSDVKKVYKEQMDEMANEIFRLKNQLEGQDN
uniref:Reverse transcriptase domain-containing protein n=1 Tax=Acrobeloides nanus TaxID=290746 RepID=A0A914EIS7_9BILA